MVVGGIGAGFVDVVFGAGGLVVVVVELIELDCWRAAIALGVAASGVP